MSRCSFMLALTVLNMLMIGPSFGNTIQLGMIVSDENKDRFQPAIETGYTRVFWYIVNTCDGISGSRTALDLVLNKSADALFGSFCSSNCIASAQIADYWDLPYFPLDCFDSTLDSSSLYKTVIRIFGSLSSYGASVSAFFRRNKWKSCAIVKEIRKDFCQFAVEAIKAKFLGDNEREKSTTQLHRNTVTQQNNHKTPYNNENSVIVICHTNASAMAALIYAAYLRGMTRPNEYAWITLYNIYSNFSFNTLFVPWMVVNDTKKSIELKEAFLSVKAMGLEINESYVSNIRPLSSTITYKNFSRLPDPDSDPNDTGHVTSRTLLMSFLTDAVYLYFILRSKTAAHNLNEKSGRIILNMSRNANYNGGVTENITMSSDADRYMTFIVWSLSPDSSTFRPYLNINFTNDSYRPFLVDVERWGYSNSPPFDKPKCGYDNIYCNGEDKTFIIASAASLAVIIFLAAFFMVVR
ncbi:hypothetical protein HELRODRAFT_171186 [Helobdella robusta]|uniref:Receptor ligand binding region domain-containing protein n=1 Tax=Helobdella robusta TaxID=6412 RepID=T1F3W9_HELRO|nr:hypothetical protein HELRODRAFT_171186 [Helobdella robusta]ESO05546.1 hypothetical protein HELRODRAFT_171186 [Helobdella robusta]